MASTWDDRSEQQKQRADVIKAAMDYVQTSGLPAYRVCSMFNIPQATLYRHLTKASKLLQQQLQQQHQQQQQLRGEMTTEAAQVATQSDVYPGASVEPEGLAQSGDFQQNVQRFQPTEEDVCFIRDEKNWGLPTRI